MQAPPTDPRWRFWIDRGGTFTDIIGRDPHGALHTHKVLSDAPDTPEDAALLGIRHLLGWPPDRPLTHAPIAEVRMGTTVVTNALLERTGARVLYVTDRGLGDLLRIGDQARPDIFALHIQTSPPLAEATMEVGGRIHRDGGLVDDGDPLDRSALLSALQGAHARGLRSIAIACMHAWRYPARETEIADIAAAAGFTEISCSHRVAPELRLLPRAETTTIRAAFQPLLRARTGHLQRTLAPAPLRMMQSSGGLTPASDFEAHTAVLSGPAGGVVAVRRVAHQAGFSRSVGLDMGGTSTDVCYIDGEPDLERGARVGGVRIRTPMLRVHTIAAGGGSVLRAQDGRLLVGPRSAGAEPGPAAYRRGGPATITDAQIVLGRLPTDALPPIFGPARDQPMCASSSRAAIAKLDPTLPPELLAAGFLDVACSQMAQAIRHVSVARGLDLHGAALVSFGGAAGQCACRVADALDVESVLVHPLAGVLSAWGIGQSPAQSVRRSAIERSLRAPGFADTLAPIAAALRQETIDALHQKGATATQVHETARVRHTGADATLPLDLHPIPTLAARFNAAHQARYGFPPPAAGRVLTELQVNAIEAAPSLPPKTIPQPRRPRPTRTTPLFIDGHPQDVALWRRDELIPAVPLAGPVVIVEANTTTVVEPGWTATLATHGVLLLTRQRTPRRTEDARNSDDPALLEVVQRRLVSIATQMGLTLARTASSVNIKERLDFSCAVFDATGQLLANAPHIPVHLGSMQAAVQAVRARFPDPCDQAWATNSPYDGGTHLPDITVVRPVLADHQVRFWVAARGHHADVGGVTPGSMPAHSAQLFEEGVLLDAIPLLDADGAFDTQTVVSALSRGPHPARNIPQNLADLAAQLAACATGAAGLRAMEQALGAQRVAACADRLLSLSADTVRDRIRGVQPGSATARLDSGAQICVRVAPQDDGLFIDFTGTSAQLPGNHNAPQAVCRAAVLYTLRTLLDGDLPINAGCMRPVRLHIPPGSLLDPGPPAAVAAGNVETSQAVVDALLHALGALAGSQGTMNNLTFGDAKQQYYETIGGGAGGGPQGPGASGVQTHMTNSRITDPELLEWRFPVVVRRFALRPGSGGRGAHAGGDGLVRTLEFRAPMTVTMVSNRRNQGARGLAGGQSGAPGAQQLKRQGGSIVDLPGTFEAQVQFGDVLRIRTPGGGGWGKA